MNINKAKIPKSLGLPAMAMVLVLLGGCATLSRDAGFGSVEALTKERIGKDLKRVKTDADRQAIRNKVNELLGKELGMDEAVQIALLNNPGLQGTYSNLNIAEADLVQAGRLRNPGFSFQKIGQGDTYEYERKFVFDLFGLLTMPTRTQIEQRRFEQTKLQVAGEAVKVAADTRRAYVTAVAAQQTARYMEDVKTAAEASAELAQRMTQAGNWSKLDEARQQAFYVEEMAYLALARQAAMAARENLTRLMGLSGKEAQYELPERLPDLPKSAKSIPDIESIDISQRLDVHMATQELEGLAKSLGLTRATRFVDVLEVSYLNRRNTGEPLQTGYEIGLQIPLFDWGDAKVAKAEALYMQAANRVSAIALNARSQARVAYGAYQSAYDIARRYRDELVPLRKQISEENVLRYNGMLIGAFELLADAQEQVASVNAYIGALRDFWLADTDLQMAMTGTGENMGMASMSDAAMMKPATE